MVNLASDRDPPSAVEVFLGLGANLGDRAAMLRAGLHGLEPEVQVKAVSALYETEPVGVLDQPPFLNAVCTARTALGPRELLEKVKAIEHAAGRRPGPRWGPRPLDIDILLYGQEITDTPALQIPHPRLTERGFVLRPLADLAPDLIIPGVGRSVRELLAAVDLHGVREIVGRGWEQREPGSAL